MIKIKNRESHMNEKSRIIEVTVYPDRALVTRQIDIEVTSETEKITFENLPSSIYRDTIRVSGKGDALLRIEGKKGITGKDTAIEYSYRLTIESYKDREETIKIFEQIPVSSNKEIAVRMIDQNNFQKPDEKGILKMKFSIKPKEKKEFTYSYSVRFPVEEMVQGLA